MDIHWDQLSKAQWQGQLATHAYGLRQDWVFGQAMALLGAKVSRAVVFDAGHAVAMAQVLQRPGLRVIGQGPVWLTSLKDRQKRRVIRCLARHCGACIVTPAQPLAGWGMVPLITPKTSALWNIHRSPEALRKGLNGKWRNRLVRAEDTVKPSPLNQSQLQDLIAEEAAQRQKRGYHNLPGAMAADWSGDSLAIGWQSAGGLQAGMVFLIHGQTASYFLGWASDVGRAAFAHGPILWQSALALGRQGVRVLDLGDVNTDTGASLARFKLGTGAGLVTAGPTCFILPSM